LAGVNGTLWIDDAALTAGVGIDRQLFIARGV
jgi:hypothetical protein